MSEATTAIGVTLVADDDESLRRRLVRALNDRGFPAVGAANFDDAVRIATERRPVTAVIDLKFGPASGLDLLRKSLAISPSMRLLVLTGYGSITTAVEVMRLGAVSYMTKPADADEIVAVLHPPAQAATRPPRVPSLANVEWDHIQRVLADCEGNVTHAARRLDIDRRSLQRKLAKQSRN